MIETRTCPICLKTFEIYQSQHGKTCSKKCGYIYKAKFDTGRPKMGKIKKQTEDTYQKDQKIKEQHRLTIFTGGYEDHQYMPVADEGEIL